MTPLRLRIDEIDVEVTAGTRARDVEATLREALELLAERLAHTPLPAPASAPARVLERIELAPLPAGWVAGPAAAGRLADELYERIARTAT